MHAVLVTEVIHLATDYSQGPHTEAPDLCLGVFPEDNACPAEHAGSEPHVVPDSPKESSQNHPLGGTHLAALIGSGPEDSGIQRPIICSQPLSNKVESASTHQLIELAVDPPNEHHHQVQRQPSMSIRNDKPVEVKATKLTNILDAFELVPGLQEELAEAPVQNFSLRPTDFDINVDALGPSKSWQVLLVVAVPALSSSIRLR